jgi:hypothetical protein
MTDSVRPSDIEAIVRAFPPGDQRPHLEIPRHWSNAGLQDPDAIIALVLLKPTTEDLARTVVAYGPRRVLDVMDRLSDGGEISGARTRQLTTWLAPVVEGVADAARQFAPA